MLKRFLMAVVAVIACASSVHGQTQAQADAEYEQSQADKNDALDWKGDVDAEIAAFDILMGELEQERDSWTYMGANWITINDFMNTYAEEHERILAGPPGLSDSYNDGVSLLAQGDIAVGKGHLAYATPDYPLAWAWYNGGQVLFRSARDIFSQFPADLEENNQGAEYFLSIW